jgi:hypothetical protein
MAIPCMYGEASLRSRAQLIQEDDTPISDSEYTIKRITVKLRNQLELLETHYKTDQEEYESICAELEKAVTERETLHLQNRLNDIHMEEYSIRLSVANWSIEDLSAKKRDLENCIKAMKNLKGLQAHGDIEDLYRISKNSYQSLNRLMIEPDTLKMLTQTLSKILETITYPSPSTL